MNELYQYSNYRSFLKDWFNQRKSLQNGFSYSVWAKSLNLKSSSTLIMILNGQRDPGPNLVKKFSEYFNFSFDELEFFEDLIEFEKGPIDKKKKLKSKIQACHIKKNLKVIDDKFNVISDWYHYAIKEMTFLKDVDFDPKKISSRLKGELSLSTVSAAIDRLVNLNLIKKDKEKMISTDSSVTTTHDKQSQALQLYHNQILKLAQKSLKDTSVEDREITGLTLSFPKSKMKLAKSKIRQFMLEFMGDMESQQGDEVYQLEIAFIPLTKNKGS